MATSKHSDDHDLLLALQHVQRRRIMRQMLGKDSISPRQVASALELPLSNVSYHIRVLAACAAVTLVDTEPVRGSVQHFYRSSLEAPWALQVLGLTAAEDETGENPGGPRT
jgi:DNA-binding transcriptional ArsR family regulator